MDIKKKMDSNTAKGKVRGRTRREGNCESGESNGIREREESEVSERKSEGQEYNRVSARGNIWARRRGSGGNKTEWKVNEGTNRAAGPTGRRGGRTSV